MRLTTKGRFAVTALLDVTLRSSDGPVNLAAVSERQQISLSYLEQLFGKLRRNKLVDSVRGPGGGYVLARAPETISVAHIIVAVDEPLDTRQCEGRADCQNGHQCMTHNLWNNLNSKMFEYLDSVSLHDLVQDHLAHNAALKSSEHVIHMQ
ncbi:Rrf2 family transcriptional regulator [Hydromonas duriensis]|uniref:BadM/Rrf2 family transcriptional regulator n=1 Tax=Hydromonas duriensis TaxID=1527608 RepID=A0A4R6Y977_9BURK|nr:Rrf2 family transcriptional regulator [Hydromonas duriensis]TDR31973.1 BadM/Rrf2 family transcriptional regulator [Hydromonas duriensis]